MTYIPVDKNPAKEGTSGMSYIYCETRNTMYCRVLGKGADLEFIIT